MIIYYLNICNKIIKVESICGDFKSFCEGYLIDNCDVVDYTISVSQEEIDEQARLSHMSNKGKLEGFVILNKLADILLLDDNAIFMHGAVVAYNDNAYMFTAPSGTGKTTHVRLWVENLKDAYILNGDKPFISINDIVCAWGSPWCGTEGYSKNTNVKLKAICLLNRSNENSIKEISFNEALPTLINQTAILKENDGLNRILKLLCQLKKKVKFYCLNIDSDNYGNDAFNVSYDALRKLQ